MAPPREQPYCCPQERKTGMGTTPVSIGTETEAHWMGRPIKKQQLGSSHTKPWFNREDILFKFITASEKPVWELITRDLLGRLTAVTLHQVNVEATPRKFGYYHAGTIPRNGRTPCVSACVTCPFVASDPSEERQPEPEVYVSTGHPTSEVRLNNLRTLRETCK